MIRLRSIRFQLLAAINAAIALLFGLFLVLDYRREIDDRVAEKHVALEEETNTLLPAVTRLRPYGDDAVQRYIDAVCGRMQETSSPGHHIAVHWGDTVIQAAAHHRASSEILEAMEAAARSSTYRAPFGNEELIVGSSRQGEAVAYVSEYVSNIRKSARRQAVRRLPWIILLLVVTAIAVNLVFWRMAARPLRQLVRTVRQIGEGHLDVRAGPFKSVEFDYLAGAINSMSATLAETQRHRQLVMDRARSIQEQLLPDEIEIPGLEFAHSYRPAEDVAGDYFDMISLPGGACLACIADVAGHGVPAALSAAMLKAYLQDASEHHTDPAEILRFLNYRLTVAGAYCFEVVYLPKETRVYLSGTDHQPMSMRGMQGHMMVHMPGNDKVSRHPLAHVSPPEKSKGQDYLATTADMGHVRDGNTTATFELANLQHAKQPRANFSQTITLAKTPVTVARPDTSVPDDRIVIVTATASDQEAIQAQRKCPVLGTALGSHGTPMKVGVGSKTLFVCCKGCVGKVVANPDGYLAKAAELREGR